MKIVFYGDGWRKVRCFVETFEMNIRKVLNKKVAAA